jgi:xanthine dehydrogenase accessory factor
MNAIATMETDILDLVQSMRRRDQPFALATVVRTVAATAAKAGSKAVILTDGTIQAGWIGGGCARGAVVRAARAALADGKPRLISVQPKDLLEEQGIQPDEERSGVQFARSFCPSRGTLDIFVEPMLPRRRLLVSGASPVAVALAPLAHSFDFSVTVAAPAASQVLFPTADRRLDGYSFSEPTGPEEYVVIATQGNGDAAALASAMAGEARYVAFVGSTRTVATLKAKLQESGVAPERLAQLRGPAGLDIGAVTPDEIALSILAEIIRERRCGQREIGES